MMNNIWIWSVVAVLAAVCVFNGILKNKGKRLPPGPIGLPLLGHLHLIGKNSHQDLAKLAKIYGPIMHLRFGFMDNIIVSSPQAAKQFLKTHDLKFANRPPSEAAKYMTYNQRTLAFSDYGHYYRNVRKLCNIALLNNHKVKSFQSMRREELCLLVESLKQAAMDGEAVDLSAKVVQMNVHMICRMLFGKKYEHTAIGRKGFKDLAQELDDLIALPNLGDYFPFLAKLDLQGLTQRMKDVVNLLDQFFERTIDEHEEATENKGDTQRTKDFVDIMLDIMKSGEFAFQFTRENIKAILLDVVVASIDTSASVIEWTMSELLKHPKVMKKLKEELERQVGLDRMVEEEDLGGLEYLEMIIKETLRMHPVAPLLLAHAAMEDCVVDDFHIPKNATIVVNAWAIGHDPYVWNDPEKFIPDRFKGSNVEYRGQDFELIPFGSGRRVCPGLQLGITVVRLVTAQLVHCFDWTLLNGMLPNELDMTEKFSVVISRAQHLMAIPTYRLHL